MYTFKHASEIAVELRQEVVPLELFIQVVPISAVGTKEHLSSTTLVVILLINIGLKHNVVVIEVVDMLRRLNNLPLTLCLLFVIYSTISGSSALAQNPSGQVTCSGALRGESVTWWFASGNEFFYWFWAHNNSDRTLTLRVHRQNGDVERYRLPPYQDYRDRYGWSNRITAVGCDLE